ncbi:DUF2220 family protein [Gilvimarinus sp. SDUM040013]|uniref:DUF2220 family protein n=1 Tax=Gilvimarinus gilvus TaxID=3058038 RepID=A0ABU4RW69_9GAMM|nr:Wadjet anti-phage system protein JetD domain-containing protein [Gilvimarinus sp. SDUM040013]MDO3386543.1 DUF2220 family protein [Gilvimarinus sp. SDUM040013]MDX6849119.1 DUF2220 family protein [Gilvimarinus sp. SDUM040013]
MRATPTPPVWLEEPLIQRLLNVFVDKLERGVKLIIKVGAKTTPELYEFDEDVQYLWALVESLDKDCKLITIKKAKVKPFQEVYEGAQLRFIPEREEVLREWLNRPALDPYAVVWNSELEKVADSNPAKAVLAHNLIRLPEWGAEQTLRGLLAIGQTLQQPMTLRQLSARCFAGHSKVLDRHEDWVRLLYPDLAHRILPRPLLVTLHLPEHFSEVLFIENQDTFLELAAQPQSHFALVYSAGFALSAERTRTKGQVVFTYTQVSDEARAGFERFWFDAHASVPVWFWGDLDFAGMAILRSLRASFAQTQAWQPGYQPLLELLQNGEAHSATMAGKTAQVDPGTTGCHYADEQLLVAIRRHNGFVDQEAVRPLLGDCY